MSSTVEEPCSFTSARKGSAPVSACGIHVLKWQARTRGVPATVRIRLNVRHIPPVPWAGKAITVETGQPDWSTAGQGGITKRLARRRAGKTQMV
jgi:hypothetical protein